MAVKLPAFFSPRPLVMVETRFLVADGLLPPPALQAALGRLAAGGWRAALLAARQAIIETAGIGHSFAAATEQPVGGDLLFRGDDLFYAITKPAGRAAWRPAVAAPVPLVVGQPELEVGLISPTRASATARLADFATRLAEALRMSGLPAELDWRQPVSARLEALRAGGGWQPARATLADFERAQAAAQPAAHEILEHLARDGYAREADLLAAGDAAPIAAALAALEYAGLVRRDLLISCHLSRRPLLLLAAPEQQRSSAVLARQCPDCGLGLGDEPLEAVVQPTSHPRGEEMPWPLVWLTERLNRLGIGPLLWYREPLAADVRLVAGDAAGQLWGWAVAAEPPGEEDVRALDRLRRRFAFDRFLLIALAGLAPAARSALNPLAMALAEGLAAAEPSMQSALADAALRYAAGRLRPLEDAAGFPLLATLRALYSRS